MGKLNPNDIDGYKIATIVLGPVLVVLCIVLFRCLTM